MLVKPPTPQRPQGPDLPVNYGHPSAYRFGAVEVDFHAGELRRSGMRIRIQDQPLHVLWLLVRHPGEVVTRDEFRKLLWPADTFVDFDHGLNSAVKRLRDALGDDPENPRLIETIPRHGYRFIAPVVEIAAGPAVGRETVSPAPRAAASLSSAAAAARSSALGVSANLGSDSPSRSGRDIWSIAVTATFLVIVGCFLGIYIRTARAGAVPPLPPITLSVLPFRDLSPGPSHGLIAEGITQELITHLGKLDRAQIVVSAHAAVEPYKSVGKPPSITASELGVDYVLEGSTQLQDSHLRVSAHLIKVSDRSYVWTESYDDTAGDLLRAQADIASQIAAAVRHKLSR